MGLCQWLYRRVLIPGEPPVDRTRKLLATPLYFVLAALSTLWTAAFVAQAQEAETTTERTSFAVDTAAAVLVAAVTIPLGLYSVWTRTVTQRMCEVPVAVGAIATVMLDFGGLIKGQPTVVAMNVVALDCLLVCECSDVITKAVLLFSVVWVCAAAVLRAESVGEYECADENARFSPGYFGVVVTHSFSSVMVFTIDFYFTRGFATSMRFQKSLVEASIQACEQAAVNLSRYETEATQALLDGPEGRGLPPGLRQALSQLVCNLAQYRPYLPQSCLPGGEDGGAGTEHRDCDADRRVGTYSETGSESEAVLAFSLSNHRPSEQRSLGSSHRSVPDDPFLRGHSFMSDVRVRKVSMVAVNTRSFLAALVHESARSVLRTEVDTFVGQVAAEGGVVDTVSGDHMFANFNASRLCTTHRFSAARVAWGMAEDSAARGHGTRTSCACSAPLLSGDFGTAELRRFMLLGAAVNIVQCLERVAARMGSVLVDQTTGADPDVGRNFDSMLVERLVFLKRGPQPFLVWQLTGRRAAVDSPEEWMYELERQVPNCHAAWNERLEEWLRFGPPFAAAELEGARPLTFAGRGVSGPREQSTLVEAAIAGGTAAQSSTPAVTDVL